MSQNNSSQAAMNQDSSANQPEIDKPQKLKISRQALNPTLSLGNKDKTNPKKEGEKDEELLSDKKTQVEPSYKTSTSVLSAKEKLFMEGANRRPQSLLELDPSKRHNSISYRMTSVERAKLIAVLKHKQLLNLTDALRFAVDYYVEQNVSKEELQAAIDEVDQYFAAKNK